MRNLSIYAKLFLSIFLVASLSLTAFGVLVFYNQKEALIQRTSEQLKSVNILKKRMVEKRLVDDEKFMWHFIRKVMLFDTTQKFSAEKEFHRHKDFLKDFCKDYGHLDVMLLNEEEQAVDSLFTGYHYTDKNGKPVFTFVRVFLIDNSPYRLALVSGTGYIQKLLFEVTGMGNTGESYLVDHEKVMITQSRFFPFKSPRSIVVNTAPVNRALESHTGTTKTLDYRNMEVLSAFAPIHHNGLKWVIISEIDESEAMLPVWKLRDILLFVSLLILIGAFLMSLFLGGVIVMPIRQVSVGMLELAQGLIPARVSVTSSQSEESKMKAALNKLILSFEGISAFASEIGKGNLKADFTPLSEKDELSKSLIHMRNQLKEYREKEKSLRRQKALSLLEGQENERKRIARDLHDGLGQWLTGLKLKIMVLKIPEAEREELKSLVSETINETRRITNNLMPNTLIDFGLDSALRQMIGNIQKSSGKIITYHYEKKEDAIDLPFEVSINLYRIAQEGLNNILKHAEADAIKLIVIKTAKEICLTLEDNGKGLPEHYKTGNGLGNMEERAKLIQGSFKLERLEKGTRVFVRIPLKTTSYA